MAITLTYTVDDSLSEKDLNLIMHAHDAFSALDDIKQYLRNNIKWHSEESKLDYDTLEAVQAEFFEITKELLSFD